MGNLISTLKEGINKKKEEREDNKQSKSTARHRNDDNTHHHPEHRQEPPPQSSGTPPRQNTALAAENNTRLGPHTLPPRPFPQAYQGNPPTPPLQDRPPPTRANYMPNADSRRRQEPVGVRPSRSGPTLGSSSGGTPVRNFFTPPNPYLSSPSRRVTSERMNNTSLRPEPLQVNRPPPRPSTPMPTYTDEERQRRELWARSALQKTNKDTEL